MRISTLIHTHTHTIDAISGQVATHRSKNRGYGLHGIPSLPLGFQSSQSSLYYKVCAKMLKTTRLVGLNIFMMY